ncbi:arrestin domain-containing protein 17-like [Episyrphus balteatus]|uniref:arrestin domain-containing protein 17-like n=1 Tax=Episyrphus balteatus TaxID=286459 RepID=UPI002484EF68|nr:arrestin domain-containing protein 17-like [Episyrphus balteatus]
MLLSVSFLRPNKNKDIIHFQEKMGIRFEILFEENPNGMYFTGQIVKGRAIVYVDEQIPFKGIQLRVRGYAKVRWDEGSGKSSDVHFDQEKYFDSVTECIDTKGLEQTLSPGIYAYDFQCVIPSECPSSFEGLYGRIRYDTKIIVVRPRAFNKSYSMGFTVLKIFDLNPLTILRIPAKLEEFKHFCCGPCKSRPLVISLEIQRQSFVPGELIEFKAKLVNNSSTTVEQVRVTLNLVALYSVRTRIKTKTEKIAIAKKKYGAFNKNTLFEFNEKLQVPPTPPTCIGLCPIIKLTYEVAVTAGVKGAHLNPFVAIPVTIGNIPYVGNAKDLFEPNLMASNLNNDIAPIPPTNEEFPPPSYEEATFVLTTYDPKDSNVSDKTVEKFIPRYHFHGNMPHIDTENTNEDIKE